MDMVKDMLCEKSLVRLGQSPCIKVPTSGQIDDRVQCNCRSLLKILELFKDQKNARVRKAAQDTKYPMEILSSRRDPSRQ